MYLPDGTANVQARWWEIMQAIADFQKAQAITETKERWDPHAIALDLVIVIISTPPFGWIVKLVDLWMYQFLV